MADISLFGLYRDLAPAAETIEQLRRLGMRDEQITVLSGIPYRPEMLGRPRLRGGVGRIALLGAILGMLTGLFLTAGIFLLYPLEQGGQPLVPIPPSLIILFEVTMLGTMWAAFFGLLVLNRLPVFRTKIYDPRISQGYIGVVAQVADDQVEALERVFRDNGAHDLRRELPAPSTRTPFLLFWGGVSALLITVTVLVLLAAYDLLPISFPSQMVHQPSVGYVQGPRLAAPADAIPIQGPAMIGGEPATKPPPATESSLQRGLVLFAITCAVCHGNPGTGDGSLANYFSPTPADLTDREVQAFPKADLFLVMSEGRGAMPSMAENLSPWERWDVANYVDHLVP